VAHKLRPHLLSIFFGTIFVLALIGQSLTGLALYNEEQAEHGMQAVTYLDFITSSHFIVDVAENWQSEYLQFFLFILATVWLIQIGSPESKQPGDEGVGTDKEQRVHRYSGDDSPRWAKARGWRLVVYSNSLLLLMGAVFLFSWWAQSIAGVTVYNDEQLEHGQASVEWLTYVASADFWNRTLQNWQSEFLAVGSMVAFSIYLRQRGSAESKPVGTPHAATAIEGE
jgi:hypothetical protein